LPCPSHDAFIIHLAKCSYMQVNTIKSGAGNILPWEHLGGVGWKVTPRFLKHVWHAKSKPRFICVAIDFIDRKDCVIPNVLRCNVFHCAALCHLLHCMQFITDIIYADRLDSSRCLTVSWPLLVWSQMLYI